MKGIIFIAAVLTALTAGAREYRALPPMHAATEEPEGELYNYTKEVAGTFVLNNRLSLYKDVFPAQIIWGSDGKVYFKNLISVFPDDYYLEGTLEGTTITMPTGQKVEEIEGSDYGVNFGVFRAMPGMQNGQEIIEFEYAPEIESISFTVSPDGGITMELPGEPFDGENLPEYVAGFYYTDDFSFVGYSDFYQKYTRLELEQITIPAAAEIRQFVYIDSFSYASIVDVAFHDGYVYIRGLSSMLPEGTIRAKMDGDTAVVAQDEFLGIYFDQYYIFTKVLYENPDYDETDPDSEPFYFAPTDVGFTLHIDKDRNRIYADTKGVYLSFHCDAEDYLNSLGYFEEFELKYQKSFAGTPANPVDLEYHTEWAEAQGFNDFFFTLSNFSTEGTLLDANKLYYKVYVNHTPVIFVEHNGENLLGEYATQYPGVPKEVELIPYYFNNNFDIFKFSDNAFDVGIYTNDVETIGVQTVYYFDGEFTYSDVVTLDVAGLSTPEADEETVATEYYTLDGRRVVNPGKGIFIQRDTLSNGKRLTKKVVR